MEMALNISTLDFPIDKAGALTIDETGDNSTGSESGSDIGFDDEVPVSNDLGDGVDETAPALSASLFQGHAMHPCN